MQQTSIPVPDSAEQAYRTRIERLASVRAAQQRIATGNQLLIATIRRARQAGCTWDDLAVTVGVSVRTLRRWMQERT